MHTKDADILDVHYFGLLKIILSLDLLTYWMSYLDLLLQNSYRKFKREENVVSKDTRESLDRGIT